MRKHRKHEHKVCDKPKQNPAGIHLPGLLDLLHQKLQAALFSCQHEELITGQHY
jgi:hypothetical protein